MAENKRFDAKKSVAVNNNGRRHKRDRDEEYNSQSTNCPKEASWSPNKKPEERRKRRRPSRWGGGEEEKVFIPGLPTALPNNLNPQQERAYLLQLQIEEISRRLRTSDLGIPLNPLDRSPSPEPIYSTDGKRLNTREYRTRKKLEDDRHNLIQEMYSVNPEYKPPADYKPLLIKLSDKVMIPQDEHLGINFVGLLIGPRGNTLKSMEKETGAKIIIRGKGSLKEGKVGRQDGQPLPGEDEPLHAFVMGNSYENIKKAVNKIQEIIRQAIEMPDGQNNLRVMQLRELALLNGTIRVNDGPRCTNCGGTTHRSWQCPDKPNVTNNIICTSCGGAGHIAKDCKEALKVGMLSAPNKAKIDEEYMSLMAELGEGPPVNQASSRDTTSTTSVFSAAAGPPKAIITPGATAQTQFQVPSVNTQAQWTTGVPKPGMHTVHTGPPSMMHTSAYGPPSNVTQVNPSVSQPMMPPWQPYQMQAPISMQQTTVLTTQGVSPAASMLTAPPPPPPTLPICTSAQRGIQPPHTMAWLTPSSQATNHRAPWQMPHQILGSGPMPVPPPGVTRMPSNIIASGDQWKTIFQSLAAAPPPPPSNSAVYTTRSHRT